MPITVLITMIITNSISTYSLISQYWSDRGSVFIPADSKHFAQIHFNPYSTTHTRFKLTGYWGTDITSPGKYINYTCWSNRGR